MSSAYIVSLDPSVCVREETWLIEVRNSKGPRTEPCRTPDTTEVVSEEAPSTTTYCCLLHNYEAIHCKMCWFRPMSSNLYRRGRWWTLLNVLPKSKKTREMSKPFSMSWRTWKVDTRAVTMDFPRQNHHCLGSREKLLICQIFKYYAVNMSFHYLANHWEERYWPVVWRIVCITWLRGALRVGSRASEAILWRSLNQCYDKWRSPTLVVYSDLILGHDHKRPSCTKPLPQGISAQ